MSSPRAQSVGLSRREKNAKNYRVGTILKRRGKVLKFTIKVDANQEKASEPRYGGLQGCRSFGRLYCCW